MEIIEAKSCLTPNGLQKLRRYEESVWL